MPPWKDRDREGIIPPQCNITVLVRSVFIGWVGRTLRNSVISSGSSVHISLPSPALTASVCQRREGLCTLKVTDLQRLCLLLLPQIPDKSDMRRSLKTKTASTHHCQDRNQIIHHPLPTTLA